MAKLLIEIGTVKLELEGTEEFLREMYGEFKHQINTASPHQFLAQDAASPNTESICKEQPALRRKRTASTPKTTKATQTKSSQEPSVDSSLPISELKEYFDNRRPKNNPECIIVFAAYLRDKHNISPCTIDQLYTCFWSLRKEIKIPRRFRQAVIDTKNKKKWVEWVDENSIQITNIGENALHHEIGQGSIE